LAAAPHWQQHQIAGSKASLAAAPHWRQLGIIGSRTAFLAAARQLQQQDTYASAAMFPHMGMLHGSKVLLKVRMLLLL
jgi:hypothetical protein